MGPLHCNNQTDSITISEGPVAKLSENQLFYLGIVAGALAAAAFVIPLTVVVSNSLS